MSEDPNKLEIEETLKKQLTFSVCCLVWLWGIALIVPILSIVQPVGNTDPVLIISISIMLGIAAIIITLFIYVRFIRGTLTLRTFKITKNFIEFNAPTQEIFKMSWSDIDRISVKRIVLGFRSIRVFFNINFEGKEHKFYKLESGKECSNNTLKSILSTLEAYSHVLNKNFVRN
ncbi:MAG: hypothetical protein ACFFCI_23485 [Promethearchaeota archaeon]